MTPFAAYLLCFAVPASGLGSPWWDVRAESQQALVSVWPASRTFARPLLGSGDPEVARRAQEVMDCRLPRSRPAPQVWEQWPKHRLR